MIDYEYLYKKKFKEINSILYFLKLTNTLIDSIICLFMLYNKINYFIYTN